MTRGGWRRIGLALGLLLALAGGAAAGDEHGAAAKHEAAAPATSICMVCQVKHGEAEAEPVKATRTHEGQSYGFCSEACAKEFSADPLAYLPPVFPRAATPFALTGLTGEAYSLESLQGRVVLLDFWATWCAPCRKSMPELQSLHAEYAARGLTVLGVSIDEKADGKVKKFVKERGYSYPIAIDAAASPAWQAYRVKSIPAAFLIDREGRVVAQWTGAAPPPDELRAAVRGALGPE